MPGLGGDPRRRGAPLDNEPAARGVADRLVALSGPWLLLVSAAVYLASTQLVTWVADPVSNRASLWPAAGFTLGALMLLPTGRWGFVLAGVALAGLADDVAWGYPAGVSIGWALANTLEPLLAAALLRRAGSRHGSLVPARNLLLFLGCAVVAGPLVGASIGTTATVLGVGGSVADVWVRSFIGDALGVLIVAPVLLSLQEATVRRSRRERIALVLTSFLVTEAVFSGVAGTWMVTMPYLLIPFFSWAALRFGVRGTVWMSLGVTILANIHTVRGDGPFALAGGPPGQEVTLLQVFLAITVSFALLLAALVADLRDRGEVEEELRREAFHDHLTGLPNRAHLTAALDAEFAAGRSPALLMCDLDRLKAVNDRYGHRAGDLLLTEVGRRLRSSVREEDLVARISGDEFVVLLREADPSVVHEVAGRIVDLVAAPVVIGPRREVRPSISVGGALAQQSATAEDLFQGADAALYQAKESGRGRVVVADDVTRLRASALMRLEDEIPAAFSEDQLVVLFQPLVDLLTSRPITVEALVHWRHPRLGLLRPERFVELVETRGSGDKLFEHVLSSALRAQRSAAGDVRVAVNLSSLHLGAPETASQLARILDEGGGSPKDLSLEVTLTDPLDGTAVSTLRDLHEQGAHLVLDHFGCGSSSMTELGKVPWRLLKVDRSFVAGLEAEPGSEAPLRAIVSMGRALGIDTGVDGVTTLRQLELVQDLGCVAAQGPWFSSPRADVAAALCTRSLRRSRIGS